MTLPHSASKPRLNKRSHEPARDALEAHGDTAHPSIQLHLAQPHALGRSLPIPHLVLAPPDLQFRKPVQRVPEPGSARREPIEGDLKVLAERLPEGRERAALLPRRRPPFPPLDEPQGLQREEAQDVQEVVVGHLAGRPVKAVDVVHAVDSRLRPRRPGTP